MRTADFNPDIVPTDKHDGASLNVFLGCDSGSNPRDFKLYKPVLVIEGADPPQTGNSHTWRKMIDLLDVIPENSNQIVLDLFEDENIDLIYLDFNNGNDDMRRNAECIKDAIRWINENKATETAVEENIVVGVSMGGPIGKWALLEMEQDNEDHQVVL